MCYFPEMAVLETQKLSLASKHAIQLSADFNHSCPGLNECIYICLHILSNPAHILKIDPALAEEIMLSGRNDNSCLLLAHE